MSLRFSDRPEHIFLYMKIPDKVLESFNNAYSIKRIIDKFNNCEFNNKVSIMYEHQGLEYQAIASKDNRKTVIEMQYPELTIYTSDFINATRLSETPSTVVDHPSHDYWYYYDTGYFKKVPKHKRSDSWKSKAVGYFNDLIGASDSSDSSDSNSSSHSNESDESDESEHVNDDYTKNLLYKMSFLLFLASTKISARCVRVYYNTKTKRMELLFYTKDGYTPFLVIILIPNKCYESPYKKI